VPKTIWPERVERLDALPVAGSGKVDREALRTRLAGDRSRARPWSDPQEAGRGL
jgi:acyl-CoA synthetase (AMP-forming)/AMP-acid ligase II